MTNYLQQQARDANTPLETLRQLGLQNRELAQIVATNPSADEQLLRDLVVTGDYLTRQNVANNPHTSPEVLLKLVWQFPQVVLDNPVFAEVINNRPNFLSQLSRKSLLHLLKQDRVPVSFLEWLAGKEDKRILLAILKYGNTPITVLNKLSNSKFPEVVEAVRLHINWQEKINNSLDEILLNAVGNEELKRTWHETKLLSLGIVPDTLIPIFDKEIKLRLAKNINTSANILSQLIKQDNKLSKYERKKLYSAIAQHPNTSSPILEQLIGDEDEEVRRLAISHPSLSLNLIQEYYRQHQAIKNLNINSEALRQLAESKYLPIRLQVARHHLTPGDVLSDLANSYEWQLRLAVAFNLNTSVNTLQQLIQDSYWQVRWAIAQNFSTPENLLQQLLKDEAAEVQDVAKRRLEDTSEAAKKNSDLIIATNLIPHRRNEPDGQGRMVILSTEMGFAKRAYLRTIDLSQLSDVVKDVSKNNWNYRLCLLNENTPIELIQELANSKDDYFRRSIAAQFFTPTNILEQLANDSSTNVRLAVAKNPNSTEDILNFLATDDSEIVRNAVICNPNISLEILQKVIRDDLTNLADKSIDSLVQKLLTGFQFTEELLSFFAKIDKLEIQTALARISNISVSILEQLTTIQHWQVRELIAQNRNISLETLETLIQDNNSRIREKAIANLLTRNDPSSQDFIGQWNIVNHPDTDAFNIDNLAKSQWLAIQIGVASHPHTSNHILEQLAREDNISLRIAVASNVNTPIDLLNVLLTDNEPSVWQAVINNPSFPTERLEQLAADKTYCFRKISIRKLAIKSLLDRNIQTASKSLAKYAQHSTPTWSRLITFFHPSTPQQFLIKNYHSQIWLERYAIAQNPNTPRQIVEQLTQDGNRIVRNAAVNNLEQNNLTEYNPDDKDIKNLLESLFRRDNLSPESIETAATVSSNKVLLAVANHPNTPKNILDKLVEHHTTQIAQAASLHINYLDAVPTDWEDIVEREIINLIQSSYSLLLINLAQLSLIPEFILNKLLQNKKDKKGIALALRAANISLNIIQEFANTGDNEIRLMIAQNHKAPAHVIEQIVREYKYSNLKSSNDYNFLISVVANPNTSTSIIETIVRNYNSELHKTLIKNPSTSQIVKERLNLLQQADTIIINSDIPITRLLTLAESKNYKTRTLVNFQLEDLAKNNNTSPNVLEELAKLSETKILQAVASNPNTPINILEELATEPDRDICLAIISNPSTPKYILEQLSKDILNYDLSALQKIVQQPNTSANTLEQIAKVSDSKILQAIAAHPNTSSDTLEYLATKNIRAIYIAVIKNSNTPEYVLEQLSEHIINCGMYALEEIAQQPNMPLNILEKLSESQYALVQRGVAKNPKTPVSILQKIMQGGYSSAWEGIAVNPNATTEILEELIDRFPILVAKNPNTPTYLLKKLANQTIIDELLIALLENPNLSLNLKKFV